MTGALELLAAALIGAAAHSGRPAESNSLPTIAGDLTVRKAVEQGLRSSPMAAAGRYEARAARAEVGSVRAMTRPQISATTFLTTGNMPGTLTSAAGVEPLAGVLTPGKPFADQNLSLMVPLYTGGRLGSQVRAAAKRADAAASGARRTEADVALMVKEAYYRAQQASAMVDVARARSTAAAEMVKVAQAMFDAGKGIAAMVSRARAELADADRMAAVAEADLAKAMLDLKAAMGVRAESAIVLSDPLVLTPVGRDLAGDLAEALRARPELEAARARLAAAASDTGAARGSFAPQVYGALMGDAWRSKEMGDGRGYAVAVTMSVPVFDGGQRRSRLAETRAMQEAARAELAALEIEAATQVRQARIDVDTAARNYATAQTAVAAALEAYEVVQLRAQNGKAIFVEQLDALAALTQARANLTMSLGDHAMAMARLDRAIGRI